MHGLSGSIAQPGPGISPALLLPIDTLYSVMLLLHCRYQKKADEVSRLLSATRAASAQQWATKPVRLQVVCQLARPQRSKFFLPQVEPYPLAVQWLTTFLCLAMSLRCCCARLQAKKAYEKEKAAYEAKKK